MDEDAKLKTRLSKLNTIARELAPTEDHKTSWIELFVAIRQAVKNVDEKLGSNESADPADHPFRERDELYIEHVESKQFEKLEDWYAHAKPMYDKMAEYSLEELGQKKDEKKPAAGKGPTSDLVKGPGWVIEIKGFHFHNNEEDLNSRNHEREYLKKTLIKNLQGQVELPDGTFTMEDFGIHLPTLVNQIKAREVSVGLNADSAKPSAGGRQQDAASSSDDGEGQQANRYDFWVQFAWTPRTPDERKEAMTMREEKANADAEKAGDAADDADEEDDN